MPIQTKKKSSCSPTEKATKAKKKKKKNSDKNPKKGSSSGSDTTLEGHSTKSISHQAHGRNSAASHSSTCPVSSCESGTRNCSWRTSSTEGRSTSSGDIFGAPYSHSPSDSVCSTGSNGERQEFESNSRLVNESVRWENELEDPKEEEQRIRIYKLNRRKRYIASLQVSTGEAEKQFYA